MIRIGALVATGLIFATAAFGQGNVPLAQDICSMGYAKASSAGRIKSMTKENMKMADTNKDGKLNKAEFDAACAKKLFKEQDKAN